MQLPLLVLSALIATTTQSVRIGDVPAIPTGIVTEPRVVHSTPAPYTTEARQLGIEGKVSVQAEFDANGNFKVLRVLRGLGHGLDESALAAIQTWRFSPAYRNGAPVSVVAQIEVDFNLDSHQQRMADELRVIEQKMIELHKAHKGVELQMKMLELRNPEAKKILLEKMRSQ
jgi:TonB family protein